MQDGFYNINLGYAANWVIGPNLSLNRETKGEGGGWKWFDSLQEAFDHYAQLNPELVMPKTQEAEMPL
jgi:hypothetical protein